MATLSYDRDDADKARKRSTIGYLISQYPAPSHTFIRREIAQLRSDGMEIKTYSVRPPVNGLENRHDREAQEETFYILRQSAGSFAIAHLSAIVRKPFAYCGLLSRALFHRVPGIKAFIWALFHFAESIVLARQLERDRITHLHSHFANSAATVGMLAAHFAGIPWSLTLHGISETDYPAGPLLPGKVEAADFVACVSWFGRAQAMRVTSPVQWHKFDIIRCGIDMQAMKPSRPLAATSSKHIICVARLSSEKGHIGLLSAFAALRQAGYSITLKLVGDGPEEGHARMLAADLGIAEHILFAGRQSEEDTLRAIGKSDFLVLPSLMEGLPVVLMEAMALEVPVIASHVAGVPELVKHGVNGLLFAPGDWTDLQKCIAFVLDNPEKAESMAAHARQSVAAEFDIRLASQALSKRFKDDLRHDQKALTPVVSIHAGV